MRSYSALAPGLELVDLGAHAVGLLAILRDESLVVLDLALLLLQAPREVVLDDAQRRRRVVRQRLNDQQRRQQVPLVDICHVIVKEPSQRCQCVYLPKLMLLAMLQRLASQ